VGEIQNQKYRRKRLRRREGEKQTEEKRQGETDGGK
jgi:hypothetical protein